jgi:hypothetical protein
MKQILNDINYLNYIFIDETYVCVNNYIFYNYSTRLYYNKQL